MLNRLPIDLFKLLQVAAILEIGGPCVGHGEGPAFLFRVRPLYNSVKVGLQVQDGLLDVAHIIADADPAGEPVVNNGLALCNLHHAAFDKYFIGLRPDHTLEVRADLLGETDGPTLVHAIQSLHGEQIVLPRRQAQWPSADRLEERYESFLARQRAS